MEHYYDNERANREKIKGMEIFEITPVILGGDPADPANKTILTRQQHINACRYWNNIIQSLRNQTDRNS